MCDWVGPSGARLTVVSTQVDRVRATLELWEADIAHRDDLEHTEETVGAILDGWPVNPVPDPQNG